MQQDSEHVARLNHELRPRGLQAVESALQLPEHDLSMLAIRYLKEDELAIGLLRLRPLLGWNWIRL